MASVNSERLKRQARLLEYVTIAWNIFEGASAIVAGILAGSIALVAFGLDSGIEVLVSAVVLWEMRHIDRAKEKTALRLISIGYWLVALYIFYDAITSLLQHHHPSPSVPGIILLIATVVVMLILSFAKNHLGELLQSSTLKADARFSLIDGALAATVLVGLVLNAFLGWWWADQLMALVLAGFAAKEGLEEWQRSD
jgi:divalent metal cation (Fe/Co/Zn/Cd) transporter